jgi:Mg(2+) transport ATPase C
VFRQRSIKITEIDKYQDDALVTFTVSMRGRNNISDVVVSLSAIQNVEYVRDV